MAYAARSRSCVFAARVAPVATCRPATAPPSRASTSRGSTSSAVPPLCLPVPASHLPVCVCGCGCVWVHVRTFAEFRHEEGGDDELARVWPCRPPTYRHPACVAPHPVTCHRPVASAVRLLRLAYILLLDSYGALKRGNTDCPVSQPLAGRKFLPPPQPVRRCRPLRHRVMRHIRRQLTGV